MITHFSSTRKTAIPNVSLALLLLGKMQLLAGARAKQKSQQTHPKSVLTGQDCPYDHIMPISPPKSGICSHQRRSISTRSRAISALNPPAAQQDEQSRKPPAPAGNVCVRRAREQVQNILCTPAAFLLPWRISPGGESHLLCISLGGTGRKTCFTGESHKEAHLGK